MPSILVSFAMVYNFRSKEDNLVPMLHYGITVLGTKFKRKIPRREHVKTLL